MTDPAEMLTPSEVEMLRRSAQEANAYGKQAFQTRKPPATPPTQIATTSASLTSPESKLPSGNLDFCSAQLSHLGIDLTSGLQRLLQEESQDTRSSSSDKTENGSSTA